MYPLPSVVPEGETPRTDVVAARLARRVAALFGVTWPGSPFGCTWVCDFACLTLAEVARGAPFPSRAHTEKGGSGAPGHTDKAVVSKGTWRRVGRGVWSQPGSPGPAAIATATLNRFGPDTKAAVVLTGVNRLLADATGAVAEVARHLAGSDVDPQLSLAVWAGLVLEVYRAQPALVVAGVQARAVQRSLMTSWGAQLIVAEDVDLSGGARSEFAPVTDSGGEGVGGTSDDPQRPTRLDLVDATLPLLGLRDLRQRAARTSVGAGVTADRLADVADSWCRRLLELGRPGRGIMWLAEQSGHRQVHAYLRVGAVVAPFVAETLPGSVTARLADPPPLPDQASLATAALLDRRAHLLAVHVAVNVLRYRDEVLASYPSARERTADRLIEAAALADRLLGPADPVTHLLRGYQVYVDLWDRLTAASPRTDQLDHLIRQTTTFQSDIVKAADRREIDPATLSYLLELTNVALTRALPAGGDSAGASRALARSWDACLLARGLNGKHVLADPAGVPDAQVFHLHHYAGHTGATGRPGDLRRALALQERVCAVRDAVVSREPVGYPAKASAARIAHELAAALATRLGETLPERDDSGRAAATQTAEAHALAVLDNPSTALLLRSKVPGAAVATIARCVLPTLAADLDDLAPNARRKVRALAGAAARLVTGEEAAGYRAIAEPGP